MMSCVAQKLDSCQTSNTSTNPSKNMLEYPFSLEWTISKNRLEALKNSTKEIRIKTAMFSAINASGVGYCLYYHPYRRNENCPNKNGIGFYLRLGKEKKVEAEYTICVKSANWRQKFNCTIDKDEIRGVNVRTVGAFFNPKYNFFVDGKCVFLIEGILKVEKTESNWKTMKNFGDLWNMDFKDVTIIVDEKEIKAHKDVLAFHSPVFAAMFYEEKYFWEIASKETSEYKAEILDASFETVEMAVKLCYDHNLVPDISVEECFLLLKFAEKYEMENIQENLEDHLGDKITVANVCEIVHYAIATKSSKLQNKCFDFLIICLSKKVIVPGMELLEKDFLKILYRKVSRRKFETL